MKTIIINASPRKNWNTAQILKEVKRGAESVDTEVKYYDLYDLNFAGCHSCMACKRKGIPDPCKCFWKDELSPILEEIYQADCLVIGSSVFYNEPTSGFRALLERVCFPAMTYDDYTSTFKGRVDVDVFLTMNAPRDFYESHYKKQFEAQFQPFRFLNGTCRIHAVCDTLQVKDYSKYNMASWDGEHKKTVHETQFPKDLENAFKIGCGIV